MVLNKRRGEEKALSSSLNASRLIRISACPANIFFNFKESFCVHTFCSCPCMTKGKHKENMINKMNLINTMQLIKNNQSCIAFPYFHTINKQVTIYYN